MNSIIPAETIYTLRQKSETKKRAKVLRRLADADANKRHHARVGGPETDDQIVHDGVYR